MDPHERDERDPDVCLNDQAKRERGVADLHEMHRYQSNLDEGDDRRSKPIIWEPPCCSSPMTAVSTAAAMRNSQTAVWRSARSWGIAIT
jgi:hypothetical protein